MLQLTFLPVLLPTMHPWGHRCVSDPCCPLHIPANNLQGKKLKARVISLTCVQNEVCYQSPDDQQLFCLDGSTGVLTKSQHIIHKEKLIFIGAFRDEDGGKGNVIQGVYTYADGSAVTRGGVPKSSTAGVVSTTTVATSVLASSSSLIPLASTVSSASVSASVTASQTSAPVKLPTSSAVGAASATPTSTSGAKKLDGRVSAYGVLGLVAVGVFVV